MELMEEEEEEPGVLFPLSSSTSSSLQHRGVRLSPSASPPSANGSYKILGSAAPSLQPHSFQYFSVPSKAIKSGSQTTTTFSTASSYSSSSEASTPTFSSLYDPPLQTAPSNHQHSLSSHPSPSQQRKIQPTVRRQQQQSPQPRATAAPAQRGSQPPQPRQQPEKNHRGRSRTARSLWQFMLDMLQDHETNPSIVSWVDRDSMEFRINDSKQLASLWGIEKENSTMDYDKLSRAIRSHYKKNVFQPVSSKKLIYKFGDSVGDSVRSAIRDELTHGERGS